MSSESEEQRRTRRDRKKQKSTNDSDEDDQLCEVGVCIMMYTRDVKLKYTVGSKFKTWTKSWANMKKIFRQI